MKLGAWLAFFIAVPDWSDDCSARSGMDEICSKERNVKTTNKAIILWYFFMVLLPPMPPHIQEIKSKVNCGG